VIDGSFRRKIKTLPELIGAIGPRPRPEPVVMCHGTFDLVHPGHIRHLLYAKSKASKLLVGLTCDAHINKAHNRPFVPEELRAMNLAALECVDYVLIDREPTPLVNIAAIQPDYFVKGYEYIGDGLHPKSADEKTVVESYGGEMIFSPGDVVYSSSAIIESEPPNIAIEKLLVLLESEGLTLGSLRDVLDRLAGPSVHVIGDTIVDSITQTSLIGAAGKTPTFSVRYEGQKRFVGGAGVVAKHLEAAGAKVTYSTVLGNDDAKNFVLEDLAATSINVNALIDRTRPTTVKDAIVAGGYRLLKIDTLDNRAISDKLLRKLTKSISSTPADVVLFSDFRHGIFNSNDIPTLIKSIPKGVFQVADSQVASRWGNILDFKGFDLITPNEREARFALGDQDTVIRPLGTRLFVEARCRNLIIKMGERGLMSFRHIENEGANGEVAVAPRSFFGVDSFVDRLVDPVGAGDALLAYATLALFTTGNAVVAAVLGAMAAAVECERDGNIPVTPRDVCEKITASERRARLA
jgi:rfaE bifunctional protein nucleotidyltransferase chain/domain